ncbi:MAG: exodeoxyribonuclease VII large subunit [Thermotogaceae bacterium]|nr:exodeoxyribonuclease VII large subunit [Thermotogaceae bacterium]
MISNTYTVSDVIEIITSYINDDPYLTNIEVVGEVADLKTRGEHAYFSLMDENSRLSCVWFGRGRYVKFKDGDMVKVLGSVRVYKKRGSITFYVEEVSHLRQKGMFIKNFEMLFMKLNNMGIFTREKNVLPELPRKIGIIASIDSAALRDILKTLRERAPLTEPYIFHAQVQGENAPDSLEKAIKKALNFELDALIISRGGGSSDDLWAFNDEKVINTVLDVVINHKIPVISGVGHAIDNVILDIIADYPVHTPTAAAELIAKKQQEFIEKLHSNLSRIYLQAQSIIEIEALNLKRKMERLIPLISRSIIQNENAIERSFNTIGKKAPESVEEKEEALMKPFKSILKTFEVKLKEEKVHLGTAITNIVKDSFKNIERKKIYLDSRIDLIRKLSPKAVMERGFLIALKEGKLVKSINELNVGEKLELILKDGKARVIVDGIQPNS